MKDVLTGRDLMTAAAAAQFYDFAGRCMDWAKTTGSLQERATYTQMGLQWLAAGAKLQTSLQLKTLANKETTELKAQTALSVDSRLTASDRQFGSIANSNREPDQ
jgi:hypothetical protein